MILRFRSRDFRNLEPLDWRPEGGRQLLVGANGAGKTSLLEAVYLLATTRSFRGARPVECRRRGADAFFLEAEVQGERRASLSVGWTAERGLERRLNGKPSTLAQHLSVLPVVAWSERDGRLLDGPPEPRRRLLDQGVVAGRPAALDLLTRYRRALDQKRRLLAEGGVGLAPWNELLAAAGVELIRLRRRYARRLQSALDELLAAGSLDLGTVELRYRPSPADVEDGARMLAALDEARGRELRERRPVLGPHRDELEVRWRGGGLRRTASAGEKKLLGLALTAARGRVLAAADRDPVYLVDDIDGELDRDRLPAAWELFRGVRQLVASSHRGEIWRAAGGVRRWLLAAGRMAGPEGSGSGLIRSSK